MKLYNIISKLTQNYQNIDIEESQYSQIIPLKYEIYCIFCSIVSGIPFMRCYCDVEPCLFEKSLLKNFLPKMWRYFSVTGDIEQQILENYITADDLMKQFQVSERLMVTNITEKISSEKYNRVDPRPKPYLMIKGTEAAGTPGLRTVKVYNPITPIPYRRYRIVFLVRNNFERIVFDRNEAENFYKISMEREEILTSLDNVKKQLSTDTTNIRDLLIQNQSMSNTINNELIEVLDKLQSSTSAESFEINEIANIKNKLNELNKLDGILNCISNLRNNLKIAIIPEMQNISKSSSDDTVNKIAKIFNFSSDNYLFKDDVLYKKFYKALKSTLKDIYPNKEEKNEFTVTHISNIKAKDNLDKKENIPFDSGKDEQKYKFMTTFPDFQQKFLQNVANDDELINLSKYFLRQQWSLVSPFHKFTGAPFKFKKVPDDPTIPEDIHVDDDFDVDDDTENAE
jgi:hypothetical protein